MASGNVICAVGCSICVLLTALILVLISIGTVEPVEYGLSYNSISKTTDQDNVYAGGWYMIGPFASFKVFPATLVNIDWTHYPDA